MAEGQICPGTWISIASPMVAEIVADAGFDFIIVDAEHHPFNTESLFHILLAFRGCDTVPLIRVPWNDEVMIKQVLDMGYEGIVTPNTNTVEEVRRAVAACRYPPTGARGFGPTRPSAYYRDGGEYARMANELIICAIQIENIRGVDEIDGIVKVPGVDWILIGPYDMTGTMGIMGQLDHPDLWAAIEKILATAKAAGVPAGVPTAGPDGIKRALAAGSQILPFGQDITFLRNAVDQALTFFKDCIKG